jgi:hypothetical protein
MYAPLLNLCIFKHEELVTSHMRIQGIEYIAQPVLSWYLLAMISLLVLYAEICTEKGNYLLLFFLYI